MYSKQHTKMIENSIPSLGRVAALVRGELMRSAIIEQELSKLKKDHPDVKSQSD